MDRLKLNKKIFDILHKEVLGIEIRNYKNPAIVDRLAELTIRICERISEDDYEEL